LAVCLRRIASKRP